MKAICQIVLLIVITASYQPTEKEKTITIEDKFSLTIPSFFSKVSNLNEDASLQYQHAWKEFYVIVIDEIKEEFAEALTDNNQTNSYSKDIAGYSSFWKNRGNRSVFLNKY